MRRRLDFEERIGLRRLLATHSNAIFQRVERGERALDRGVGVMVNYSARAAGLCVGCGGPVDSYSLDCRACQLRHNTRWRRFMEYGILPGAKVLQSNGRARLVAL